MGYDSFAPAPTTRRPARLHGRAQARRSRTGTSGAWPVRSAFGRWSRTARRARRSTSRRVPRPAEDQSDRPRGVGCRRRDRARARGSCEPSGAMNARWKEYRGATASGLKTTERACEQAFVPIGWGRFELPTSASRTGKRGNTRPNVCQRAPSGACWSTCDRMEAGKNLAPTIPGAAGLTPSLPAPAGASGGRRDRRRRPATSDALGRAPRSQPSWTRPVVPWSQDGRRRRPPVVIGPAGRTSTGPARGGDLR